MIRLTLQPQKAVHTVNRGHVLLLHFWAATAVAGQLTPVGKQMHMPPGCMAAMLVEFLAWLTDGCYALDLQHANMLYASCLYW